METKTYDGRTRTTATKREMIRARILKEIGHHPTRLMAFDPAQSHDEKLRQLGTGMGLLAQSLGRKLPAEFGTHGRLMQIAAHCTGWVSELGSNSFSPLLAIEAERRRQIELFNTRQISFDVASPVPDEVRKYRVLLEEAGEVAQEIDNLEKTNHSRKQVRQNLITELIQVAAVAVAWLEALEVKP